MSKAPHDHVPDCVLGALRASLGERLVAVVLYGSRASPRAREGSDWDFLVIARGLPEGPVARHLAVKGALPPECRGAAAFLAKTPGEFTAHLSALHLDIAVDGQILYDPTGYAEGLLGRIRELLTRRGLYRVRTPAGDVWQWAEQPAGEWVLEWDP